MRLGPLDDYELSKTIRVPRAICHPANLPRGVLHVRFISLPQDLAPPKAETRRDARAGPSLKTSLFV